MGLFDWKVYDYSENDEDEEEVYWYGNQVGWIDKNEKMPEMYQRVFIVLADARVYETLYTGEEPENWKFGKSDILYWMPMPNTSGLKGVKDYVD